MSEPVDTVTAMETTSSFELAIASLWYARDRAERAQAMLADLEAPEHLIDAVRRSHGELCETAHRLAERLESARTAA